MLKDYNRLDTMENADIRETLHLFAIEDKTDSHRQK
jgi:hypothetical protein